MHVDSDPFAGFDDADDGGDAGRGLGTADVQSVFPAEGDGPDTLLAPVVVNLGLSIFQSAPQRGAQVEGVAAGPRKGSSRE